MYQRTIASFFKPTSTGAVKRQAYDDDDDDESVPKRIIFEDAASRENRLLPLDQRAEANKWKAKIKLQSKKTPALSPNIGISWFKALEKEFQQQYFQELSEKLVRKNSIVYPPTDMVYTWTKLCEIEDVKVVILGQDPYHGPGQAHGLAFSVQVGISIPRSLVNIYKELTNDISDFIAPKHGCLKGWAAQGVLLLNASLTVEARCPNSHQSFGWEKFTDAVIKWIDSNLENVVFLLWGAYAQKKALLVNKKKHLVLTSAHPSPFSADRGFFGCCHFSKTNDYLEKCGKKPINWSFLPAE